MKLRGLYAAIRSSLLKEERLQSYSGEGLNLFRIRSYNKFIAHQARYADQYERHAKKLDCFAKNKGKRFLVDGYSYAAGQQSQFIVDRDLSGVINWRETVNCVKTGFNNRMRATFHLFDLEMESYPDTNLYITEQVTPAYTYFSNKFSNTVGSEYFGERLPLGCVDQNGIRNESLCELTFSDNSFDSIVSLDVLEHIPDYQQAMKECLRVLRHGGKMMWSVPFVPAARENLVRAIIKNGEIIHIQPPEYHGDPLSSDGVLCFQHFGWEMLEQMRAAGFRDAYALCYQSIDFGYLGGEQFMFVATK